MARTKKRASRAKPSKGNGNDDALPGITKAQEAYDDQRSKLSLRDKRTPVQFGQKDTPAMRKAFLDWLRLGVTPSRAARECELGGRTVWDWRYKDPEFEEQWKAAAQEGIDRLEDEAVRRGVEGTDRPVFQQGECVGFVREYSDDLLKFVLSARDPGKFSRGAQQPGGPPIGGLNFTFNFGSGNATISASDAATELHKTMDGSVSNGRDLQRQPLLDNRGDDKGR